MLGVTWKSTTWIWMELVVWERFVLVPVTVTE